jgi:hypothetical protein
MRIDITQRERRALDKLRGLPSGAHMLLMCAHRTESGATLEGSEEAFTELIDFISEELADGMVSAASGAVLYALCVRIDPDCADWLGM